MFVVDAHPKSVAVHIDVGVFRWIGYVFVIHGTRRPGPVGVAQGFSGAYIDVAITHIGGEANLEVFANFAVQTCVEVVSFKPSVQYVAIFIQKTARKAIGCFFSTTRDAQVLAHLHARSSDQVDPIGGVVRVDVRSFGSRKTCSGSTFQNPVGVKGFVKLRGIHQFRQVGRIFHPNVAVIADSGFPGNPFFGRNDDHPIGPTRAVNGRRRSVFEDVHRLDVVGIEVVDVAAHQPIDDDEWFSGVVDGVFATDGDAVPRSRLVVQFGYGGTCNLSLNRFGRNDRVTPNDVLGLHRGDRSGQVRFFDFAITHYHYFIEEQIILFQDDGYVGLVAHHHFLGKKTSKTKNENTIFIWNIQ